MGLIRDFQVGVRNVRRSPGAALTVALTVSVGVASIATVFTVVDAPVPRAAARGRAALRARQRPCDRRGRLDLPLRFDRDLAGAFRRQVGKPLQRPFRVQLAPRQPRRGGRRARRAASPAWESRSSSPATTSACSGPTPRSAGSSGRRRTRAPRLRKWPCSPTPRGGPASAPTPHSSDARSSSTGVPSRSWACTTPGFVGTFLAQPFDVFVPLSARATIAPGEP